MLTDNSNSLSGKRNVVSPSSRVEDVSLEVVHTCHTLRSIEGHGESSHSTDEDLELLLPDISGNEILEFDLIVLSFLTPDGSDEESRELGLLGEVVLLEDEIPILLDFGLRRVDGGPVGIEFGREGVPMRGNVASTSAELEESVSNWQPNRRTTPVREESREYRENDDGVMRLPRVGVGFPSSGGTNALLKNGERFQSELLSELNGGADSTGTSWRSAGSEEEGRRSRTKSQLEISTNTQRGRSAFAEVRECVTKCDLPGSDDTDTNLLLDGHDRNGYGNRGVAESAAVMGSGEESCEKVERRRTSGLREDKPADRNFERTGEVPLPRRCCSQISTS